MGSNSNSECDRSDSEMHEHKEKPYRLLKDGKLKVKRSDGSLKCPFCLGKKNKSTSTKIFFNMHVQKKC